MKISIIIVSYNTVDLTCSCIESVFSQVSSIEFEVIVVDNASTDGSALEIERRWSKVKLIREKYNIGFARANNLGIRNSSGDLILLLNSDTLIIDNALERLVRFARDNLDAGIWGGRTLFADGTLNPTSCWRFMSLWSVFAQSVGLTMLFRHSELVNRESYGQWQRDSVREVDIVTGCYLLIRRELWERLGGFDERFFMYSEEADLCRRAHALGARPLFCPDSVIIHYGGGSQSHVSADKRMQWLAGRITFMKKHWSPLSAAMGQMLLALLVIIRCIGYQLLSRSTGHGAPNAVSWTNIWTNRRRWISGY